MIRHHPHSRRKARGLYILSLRIHSWNWSSLLCAKRGAFQLFRLFSFPSLAEQGPGRVRPALLQPRLLHPSGAEGGAVQMQVPLVLLRGVRGVLQGRRGQHMQLSSSKVSAVLYVVLNDVSKVIFLKKSIWQRRPFSGWQTGERGVGVKVAKWKKNWRGTVFSSPFLKNLLGELGSFGQDFLIWNVPCLGAGA